MVFVLEVDYLYGNSQPHSGLGKEVQALFSLECQRSLPQSKVIQIPNSYACVIHRIYNTCIYIRIYIYTHTPFNPVHSYVYLQSAVESKAGLQIAEAFLIAWPHHHNELPQFAGEHRQVVQTVDVGSNCGAEQEVSFQIAEQQLCSTAILVIQPLLVFCCLVSGVHSYFVSLKKHLRQFTGCHWKMDEHRYSWLVVWNIFYFPQQLG